MYLCSVANYGSYLATLGFNRSLNVHKSCNRLAQGTYGDALIVPISPTLSAEKDLSEFSIAPTLGLDATIGTYPQHRPIIAPIPHQDEYLVPYFFYGTLADPEKLTDTLKLDGKPVLRNAEIWRGRLKIWGQYFALVDGSEKDFVPGFVYGVKSQKYEEVLRWYQTGKYEVIRCMIHTEGRRVPGLTFR